MIRTFSRRKRASTPPVSESEEDEHLELPSICYTYIKMLDRPSLRTPDGSRMLDKLRLTRFINAAQPPLINKHLCDEFIATYDSSTFLGVVKNSPVVISVPALAQVTGLIHDGERYKLLKNIKQYNLVWSKRPKGFDVFKVEHENQREFIEVASVLNEKMFCKTGFIRFCRRGLVVRMIMCLEGKDVDWASYMAQLMRSAVEDISRKEPESTRFVFGQWLTALIHLQLNGFDHAKLDVPRLPPPPLVDSASPGPPEENDIKLLLPLEGLPAPECMRRLTYDLVSKGGKVSAPNEEELRKKLAEKDEKLDEVCRELERVKAECGLREKELKNEVEGLKKEVNEMEMKVARDIDMFVSKPLEALQVFLRMKKKLRG